MFTKIEEEAYSNIFQWRVCYFQKILFVFQIEIPFLEPLAYCLKMHALDTGYTSMRYLHQPNQCRTKSLEQKINLKRSRYGRYFQNTV
jgi:hypothetical protein